MAITFACSLGIMATLTLAKPLKQDIEMPVNTSMDLSSSTGAKIGGAAVLAISALLYFIFSGLWF